MEHKWTFTTKDETLAKNLTTKESWEALDKYLLEYRQQKRLHSDKRNTEQSDPNQQ